jgi:predicted Fe-S protein YdhL (DUF1289 family)
MDPRSGWCAGCQRSLDEIAAWSTMEDADKHRVWQLLVERRVTVLAQAPASLAT